MASPMKWRPVMVLILPHLQRVEDSGFREFDRRYDRANATAACAFGRTHRGGGFRAGDEPADELTFKPHLVRQGRRPPARAQRGFRPARTLLREYGDG